MNLDEELARLRSGGVAAVDVAGQPILCTRVYETDRSQAEIYLLRPGQRIPAHFHTGIDDVFLGVSGRGQVRTWDSVGQTTDHPVTAGTVVVVEPGTPHQVSCAGDEFGYVLTQSPKESYDLHPHEAAGG